VKKALLYFSGRILTKDREKRMADRKRRTAPSREFIREREESSRNRRPSRNRYQEDYDSDDYDDYDEEEYDDEYEDDYDEDYEANYQPSAYKSRRIENAKRNQFQHKLNRILFWVVVLLIILFIAVFYF